MSYLELYVAVSLVMGILAAGIWWVDYGDEMNWRWRPIVAVGVCGMIATVWPVLLVGLVWERLRRT